MVFWISIPGRHKSPDVIEYRISMSRLYSAVNEVISDDLQIHY